MGDSRQLLNDNTNVQFHFHFHNSKNEISVIVIIMLQFCDNTIVYNYLIIKRRRVIQAYIPFRHL